MKIVKSVLKAIGVNVNKKSARAEKMPTESTIQAIENTLKGNVVKAKSVDELFKTI